MRFARQRVLLMLAASLFLLPAVEAQQQNCPAFCSGEVSDWPQGTDPGLDLIVLIGTPSNGTGSEFCTTCDPCRVGVAVNWTGINSGRCIVINHGGSGWSPPAISYVRVGRLTTQCDGNSDCIELQVGNCFTIPGTYDYQRIICLFCQCTVH